MEVEPCSPGCDGPAADLVLSSSLAFSVSVFVKVEPCSPGFWEARLLTTYPQGLALSWSWAHVWFEV